MWTDFRMPSLGRQGGNAGAVVTARKCRKFLTGSVTGCKGAGGYRSPVADPRVSIRSVPRLDHGKPILIEGKIPSISTSQQRIKFADLPWSKPTANPCQSTNPRSRSNNYIYCLLLLLCFTNKKDKKPITPTNTSSIHSLGKLPQGRVSQVIQLCVSYRRFGKKSHAATLSLPFPSLSNLVNHIQAASYHRMQVLLQNPVSEKLGKTGEVMALPVGQAGMRKFVASKSEFSSGSMLVDGQVDSLSLYGVGVLDVDVLFDACVAVTNVNVESFGKFFGQRFESADALRGICTHGHAPVFRNDLRGELVKTCGHVYQVFPVSIAAIGIK